MVENNDHYSELIRQSQETLFSLAEFDSSSYFLGFDADDPNILRFTMIVQSILSGESFDFVGDFGSGVEQLTFLTKIDSDTKEITYSLVIDDRELSLGAIEVASSIIKMTEEIAEMKKT